MPSINEHFNDKKTLAMLARVASIQSQLLCTNYSYYEVKRMIKLDDSDSELEASGNDPLSIILVDALHAMERVTQKGSNEISITPSASVALLFSPEMKELSPKLFLCFDLATDNAKCIGCVTCCKFKRTEDLLLQRYTNQYIVQKSLPRNLSSFLFIDVISTRLKRPPCGHLLLLNCILYALKAKYAGIAFVGVTNDGIKLAQAFKMESHGPYREDGATRTLFYLPMGNIDFEHINQKLHIGRANAILLESICTRAGLQIRNSNRVYARC